MSQYWAISRLGYFPLTIKVVTSWCTLHRREMEEEELCNDSHELGYIDCHCHLADDMFDKVSQS